MFRPLMPQGVEHGPLSLIATPAQVVFRPLMPQGVEHMLQRCSRKKVLIVFRPLMPQGVEHISSIIMKISPRRCSVR